MEVMQFVYVFEIHIVIVYFQAVAPAVMLMTKDNIA